MRKSFLMRRQGFTGHVSSRAQTSSGGIVWPGYLDILANTVLLVIFLLVIFILYQGALSWQFQQTNRELGQAQEKVQEVLSELGLDVSGQLDEQIEAVYQIARSSLATQSKGKQEEASFQIQELKRQISALNEALQAAEAKNAHEDVFLYEAGRRLNSALATTAQEIARYQSAFYQALDRALPEHSGFQVAGDRFIFPSDILFAEGSDTLNERGQRQLVILRDAVLDLEHRISDTIPWILRIDGHTDNLPIRNQRFSSNWELSQARALSVVRYLQNSGVNPKHMAATGFSQYHPAHTGADQQTLRMNRRIEITLTRR